MSQKALLTEIQFILKSLCRIAAKPPWPFLKINPPDFQNLDWQKVIEIGQTHRVLGFVAFALEEEDVFKNLKPELQLDLAKILMQTECENRSRMDQFKTVSHLFAQKNIPIIPLKGIDLSLRVYRDMPFRQMGDLDVLVRVNDLTQASQCLWDHGFHLKKFRTKNRWQDSIRFDPDKPLEKHASGRASFEKEGLDVDLHWSPRYQVGGHEIQMALKRAWTESRLCPGLGEEQIRVLSPEDAACHLTLHTAEMYNPSLIQILDLALMMNLLGNQAAEIILSRLPIPAESSRIKIEILLKDVQTIFKAGGASERLIQFFILHKPSEFYRKEWIPEADLSIRLRSPVNRLLYGLGYFFPNPEYYGSKKGFAQYGVHGKNLAIGVRRRLKEKLAG